MQRRILGSEDHICRDPFSLPSTELECMTLSTLLEDEGQWTGRASYLEIGIVQRLDFLPLNGHRQHLLMQPEP